MSILRATTTCRFFKTTLTWCVVESHMKTRLVFLLFCPEVGFFLSCCPESGLCWCPCSTAFFAIVFMAFTLSIAFCNGKPDSENVPYLIPQTYLSDRNNNVTRVSQYCNIMGIDWSSFWPRLWKRKCSAINQGLGERWLSNSFTMTSNSLVGCQITHKTLCLSSHHS